MPVDVIVLFSIHKLKKCVMDWNITMHRLSAKTFSFGLVFFLSYWLYLASFSGLEQGYKISCDLYRVELKGPAVRRVSWTWTLQTLEPFLLRLVPWAV